MNDTFKQYKDLFIEETEEYLGILNENLIALEKEKKNSKLIDNIFRVAHTLKSSAAAIGLNDLSKLAHKSEDLIQKIRGGECEVTSKIVDTLFEVFDVIQGYTHSLKEGVESTVDIESAISRVEAISEETDHAKKKEPKKDKKLLKAEKEKKIRELEKINFTEYEVNVLAEEIKNDKKAFLIIAEIDEREQLKWLRAELLLNAINKIADIITVNPKKESFLLPSFEGIFAIVIATKEDQQKIPAKIMIDLIENITVKTIEVSNNGDIKTGSGESISKIELTNKEKEYQISAIGDTVRVPVRKLDNLMNLVGELVIINSGLKQVEENLRPLDNSLYNEMNGIVEKLISISSDLQYNVMNTRMLPISTVFHQFPRVIRDLAKEENKDIELIIKGEETELDKKLIDTIGEPIMHLVRNAVDHGIETIDTRKIAGKSGKGKIILSAQQSGNHIIISILDDGNGIDIQKVGEKAIEVGYIDKSDLKNMNKDDILEYIFKPGISTSTEVSEVSGRGVGMDVVKKVVEELNGIIEINTEVGKMTEFIITLPLTLATSSAVLVASNETVYAVPIADIQETIKVDINEIRTIDGYEAINLRDEILPLVSLHEIFDGGKEKEDVNDKYSVVILSYQNKKAGLIVKRIIGGQEILLKPLEKNYKSIQGLSGAAILGDGTIVLVVDVIGIINLAKNNLKNINDSKGNKHKKKDSKNLKKAV